MHWEVEFTEEFETWWNARSEEEQEEISAKVELLEEHGSQLGPASRRCHYHLAPCQHEGAAGEGECKG